VPGLDVAGVVTDVGQGVSTGVAIGDRVMSTVVWSGTHGAYREDIVLPARSVVAVPAGATDVEAATLPLNGLTALQALDLLALDPGRVLAVTGAAGAVGGYVVQLAKVAGLTVVADASEADEDLVRSLGADVVVLRGPDLAERFRSQFPDGVDGQRGLRVTPVIVSTYAEEWEKLDRLRRLAEEGKVTLRVAGTYPAEQAAEAPPPVRGRRGPRPLGAGLRLSGPVGRPARSPVTAPAASPASQRPGRPRAVTGHWHCPLADTSASLAA
jgi:NADPH2:quinone reductase